MVSTKRFSTSQGEIVATVVQVEGSLRTWRLTVDGVEVGTIARSGSSAHMRTTIAGAPVGYAGGWYGGTFERAAVEVGLAGLGWLRAAERETTIAAMTADMAERDAERETTIAAMTADLRDEPAAHVEHYVAVLVTDGSPSWATACGAGGDAVTSGGLDTVTCRKCLAIEQAKVEILADVAAGIVPADVTTFSALHDHVDANVYGGLCDGSWHVGQPGDLDDANAVQGQVDAWLRSGALAQAVTA